MSRLHFDTSAELIQKKLDPAIQSGKIRQLEEAVMRQAFLIVVVALWSAPVRGQFSTPYIYYDGQNRSVSSHADATGSLFIIPPVATVTNEATITAPDFQPFNQNLVEASTSPDLNGGASATATATQNSLFGFKLSATGATSAEAGSFRSGATGSASSSFQTTFSFLTSTPEILSVQLSAHVDGGLNPSYSYANATFTLSGGSTNIVLATNLSILTPQQDSIVTFPPTQLRGDPGQLYTISVDAAAFDRDVGDLLSYGYGPSANASYSFSLTPAPEPSSIALLLIGSAVLIARAKPIRYRVFGQNS
jgi:hypothetical protein